MTILRTEISECVYRLCHNGIGQCCNSTVAGHKNGKMPENLLLTEFCQTCKYSQKARNLNRLIKGGIGAKA